jgi:mannosyltransferase OCH1-like enzyme
MRSFLRKAIHWLFYRISIRQPKLVGWLTGELPTRPVSNLYTAVAPWQSKIPNVVYQTWIDASFGRSHRNALAAFRRRNADFSFRFFSDADVDCFMAEQFGDHPIYDVYKNAQFGPLKTDIWRYCLLYRLGGVYCDIGKAIKKPLCEFIQPSASAVIAWEKRNVSPFPISPLAARTLQYPDKRVINWVMIFAPNHPILKRAIDGIVERYPLVRGKPVANPKDSILAFTGPVWLTKCILEAVEAGEFDDVVQAGIEFDDSADWSLPGSYVRYIGRPAYILARDQPIVS